MGLLVVGIALNSEEWDPAAWISADGINWEKHYLESGIDKYAYASAHNETFLVVGGGSWEEKNSLLDYYPRSWYSTDNGSNWHLGTVDNTNTRGYVEQIIVGENAFYASTITLFNTKLSLLWRSFDGNHWEIVEDPEVADRSSFEKPKVSETGM